MKDQLLAAARRYWSDFRGFSAGQKAVTVAALIALLVGGVLFTSWKSSPTYAPLYTNLAPSDASAIVDKLNTAGVPYRLGAAGTQILVPQDKVYSTRLSVSAAGLPSSGQTGYALLDKEGITTSDFKQQVDYQRALEGELTRTIEAMAGVQSASVHLAIPQQNVFNDGSQKTTAAVMLTLGSGGQLTTQQVQSIVYLVSSAVPGLSADDVTVADASGRLLATPGGGVTGTVGSDSASQAEQNYDNELEAKLTALLAPVVGTGHAVVTVNAALNFDKTSTTTNSYLNDPNAPPLSQQTTSEKYTGNQVNSGTLGAAAAAGTTGSTGGSYSKTSTTVNNALGTKTQTVVSAPGQPRKQSVGVLLDSSVKGVSTAQITALLTTAAGIDATRGDTISIQAMPFDTSAQKAADATSAAAGKAAAAKAAKARMAAMIKQGALAGVLLAVLAGTWIASRKRRSAAPLDPPTPLDDLFGSAPTDDLPPVADVSPPQIAVEVREAAARRRALVALAEEQPSDVASVISGWLNSRDSDLLNDRGPRNPWSSSLSGKGGAR
jgi:flagellar M-ring protein FliF